MLHWIIIQKTARAIQYDINISIENRIHSKSMEKWSFGKYRYLPIKVQYLNKKPKAIVIQYRYTIWYFCLSPYPDRNTNPRALWLRQSFLDWVCKSGPSPRWFNIVVPRHSSFESYPWDDMERAADTLRYIDKLLQAISNRAKSLLWIREVS